MARNVSQLAEVDGSSENSLFAGNFGQLTLGSKRPAVWAIPLIRSPGLASRSWLPGFARVSGCAPFRQHLPERSTWNIPAADVVSTALPPRSTM